MQNELFCAFRFRLRSLESKHKGKKKEQNLQIFLLRVLFSLKRPENKEKGNCSTDMELERKAYVFG